jgi:hypothetical protein
MADLPPALPPQQTNEEIVTAAENYYAWYQAYMGAGFSEQQAFMLCCRPLVILNNNMDSGPEISQAMSKMSMLFDRSLAEGADE